MTRLKPTFNPYEFETREYTNPWLTDAQKLAVRDTEGRVEGQLDFLAQMLGWSGPNYWGNLPETVSQKRQLLGGSYGVYNGYTLPEIHSVNNWENSITVYGQPYLERAQFITLEGATQDIKNYPIKSLTASGDKLTYFFDTLPDTFYTAVESGTPIKVNSPERRPKPFYRPEAGVSGDNIFNVSSVGTSLVLYPGWDTNKSFPYLFPTLFLGSFYYFDQPVTLYSKNLSSPVTILPEYDETLGKWYLQVPSFFDTQGTLSWDYSDSASLISSTISVNFQNWVDPSDWGDQNTLTNFTGVWGNKGGPLPFDFAFDSLSIHGYSERNSLYLPNIERTLQFNDVVNLVYYQKSIQQEDDPGYPKDLQLWWNTETGVLSVWYEDTNPCSPWVQVNYRDFPGVVLVPSVIYSDVATFRTNSGSLEIGTTVQILDITGLAITDNVIGVQGTLTAAGTMVLSRNTSSVYWTPFSLSYLNVTNFNADAKLLPYKIPVTVMDCTGLLPQGVNYNVSNLKITIAGNYECVLTKLYTNTNWEISRDSLLRYVAQTSLFDGFLSGQMWWDFTNNIPPTRSAAIYVSSPSPISTLGISNPGSGLTNGVYTAVPLTSLTSESGGGATADITVSGNVVTSVAINGPGDLYQQNDILIPDATSYPALAGSVFYVKSATADNWVAANNYATVSTPGSDLNMGVVLFYCDGNLLTDGTPYSTGDYVFTYSSNFATGEYTFTYEPRTLTGKVKFPRITVSDCLTSVFVENISNLVFSGVTYFMSPNVFDASVPLRLWKGEELQATGNISHLLENNFPNPLLADLNSGPGPENWERYFIRLPLDYGRNSDEWQKTALICQNFAYWGSSVTPEFMDCPPEETVPLIYEALFLYDQPIPDYTYVYCEPYLYSNIGYYTLTTMGDYTNAGIFPSTPVQFSEYTEANLTEYNALHNRRANTTSPVNGGYGNWEGQYINVSPCINLSGYLVNDLLSEAVTPIAAPVWDASIYKFAPSCGNQPETYAVDSNHYKLGYAYFVADASAAEEGFFDPQQEAAARYPTTQPKTLYLTHR